jgi:hypothetical protein
MGTHLKITTQFPKGSHLSNIFASTCVSPIASTVIGIFVVINWRAPPEIQHFGGPSHSLLL